MGRGRRGCDGSSRIKSEKIGVNPLYPRHPSSINQRANVKNAPGKAKDE
jgi:hypothetical protein